VKATRDAVVHLRAATRSLAAANLYTWQRGIRRCARRSRAIIPLYGRAFVPEEFYVTVRHAGDPDRDRSIAGAGDEVLIPTRPGRMPRRDGIMEGAD